MHVNILEIGRAGWFVQRSAKTDNGLIGKESRYLRLVDAGDNHIEADVKFEAIQKVWVVNVTLDDQVFVAFVI